MIKYTQAEKVIMREIAGEFILVPIKGRLADLQRIYMLEGIGSFLWTTLNKPITEEEIVLRVVEEFDVDKHTAMLDVRDFLAKMKKEGLIVENMA